jgi:hypothetical protein
MILECVEPLGLTIYGGRPSSRRHPQHAFGTREREARHIAGRGSQVIEGFRGTVNGRLVQQAQYDFAQVHRDCTKIKRPVFA